MACYKELSDEEWQSKIEFFEENFNSCRLCPRMCRVKRSSGEKGFCRTGKNVRIASYNLHCGEEPPVSGTRGSGTVFFSGCTLKCTFCQNYPISQLNNGKDYSVNELSDIFIHLWKKGAHNINLVSPTPYLYQIVSALKKASAEGLDIPLVYNSGGYERREIIGGLRNLVDIYMPDFKYADPELSAEYSGAADYRKNAFAAITEMFQQVGPLRTDRKGIGKRGVIIRHLILPGLTKNSKQVLEIISSGNFRGAFLSLMSQYFPAYLSPDDEIIGRKLNSEEYEEVKSFAFSKGLKRGWYQDI